jgi:hypothetical protein
MRPCHFTRSLQTRQGLGVAPAAMPCQNGVTTSDSKTRDMSTWCQAIPRCSHWAFARRVDPRSQQALRSEKWSVTPMTCSPASLSSSAATAESVPPLIPTTTLMEPAHLSDGIVARGHEPTVDLKHTGAHYPSGAPASLGTPLPLFPEPSEYSYVS